MDFDFIFLMGSRVAIVDYRGHVIYEAYVQPTNAVTDLRAGSTGLEPADLAPPSMSQASVSTRL